MTTTQVTPNGHHPLPPPFSVENPASHNPPDVPPIKEKYLGYSYQLKRRISTPTDPYASEIDIDTTPLPDRCQFFFSGGRQCRMLRSEIHPNLCPFHAAREDELFEPPRRGPINTRPDLPELYCACEDLGTAVGVNRALAHVFRMLALRRITRQEAATFGHLAQLLLRTISAMRSESADAASIGVPSEQREPRTPLSYQSVTLREQGSVEEEIIPPLANKLPLAVNCQCATKPQSHASPATAQRLPLQPHASAPASAANEASPGTCHSSAAPYKRAVPDFASMLSASRTALGSTAPRSEVPQNHPLLENVRQLPQNQHDVTNPQCPQNQHLRNRGA